MEKACRGHFELYVAKENTGGSQHLRITTLFGHISARSSIPKKMKFCGGYANHFCRAKGFDFFPEPGTVCCNHSDASAPTKTCGQAWQIDWFL